MSPIGVVYRCLVFVMLVICRCLGIVVVYRRLVVVVVFTPR
jgi:hypothetical protein